MIRNIVITCKVIQRELGLSDIAYRKVLQEVAGVNSSKDLNQEMGRRVISVLEQMGKKPEVKRPIIDATTLYKSTIRKNPPWKFDRNVSDEKWNNIGQLISDYSDKGIVVVAVMPAYGNRYIKWRYK